MLCSNRILEDVFVTDKGAVRQCNNKNCYWLDFKGKETRLKIGDLFYFKKRIDQIDIDKMLHDPSRSSDFEIIMPFRIERCFVLSVQDILHLREILAGAKFMIELNSQIKSCFNKGAYLALV